MFCYKCGCEIPNDAQFCSKCGTEQKKNLSKVEKAQSNEYSNEVLKLYFRNLLSLECIKNKLQNDLVELENDIETKESNNYYQGYYIYTVNNSYSFYNGRPVYLHLYYDGDKVNFAKFKYGGGSNLTPTVNGYSIYTNQELNYSPLFGYVTEWAPVEKERIIFETIWQYEEKGLFFTTIKEDKNIKEYCLKVYSDFKNTAPDMYKQNSVEIESLKNDLENIATEIEKASSLLAQAYDVNIVPKQFRNLYAIYYLSDFINTSNESLSTALLNYNLEEIKEKLDEIIEQQQEIIINQALMIAQNEKIMKQNQQQLNYLASIEQNTDRAAQYAQIAANNAEACAWIGLANYINS